MNIKLKLLFSAFLLHVGAAAFSGDNGTLPTIYITGTASVCPGTAYQYTLVSNLCTVTAFDWVITGGTITSGPIGGGGGGGGVEISAVSPKNTGGGVTPLVTTIATVWVIWNSNGTKSIGANITTPDACNNFAALIGGPITFQVPSANPSTPSIPVASIPGGKYCVGDAISLTTSASENSNGSTGDDVSFRWEASINGGTFTAIQFSSYGSTSYTVPATSFTNPNQYNTIRFRVKSVYNACSNAESSYSSTSAPSYIYPAAPSIASSSTTDRICNDLGSFTITSLNTAGTSTTVYFIQIQGGNSYSFTGAQLPYTISGLSNNTYNYQIFYYDTPNATHAPCSSSGTFTINDGSYTLSITPTVTNETCPQLNNGSITLTHNNGTSPFVYAWSKNSVPNFAVVKDISSLQGSTAGVPYQVSITDVHGCTGTSSSLVYEPAELAVTNLTQNQAVTCPGGSDGQASITVTGGTAPLSYSKDGSTFQTSNIFAGLAAGSYTFTVRDANACTTTSNAISITEPSPITATFSKTDATCFGLSNGSLTITAANGNAGSYTYSINAGTSYQGSNTFNGLMAGSYTIQVRDSKGCTRDFSSPSISQPASINVVSTATAVTCFGGTNGSITVTVPTGAGYTYTLDGITWQASTVFNSLPSSVYTVTAKNSAGCTGSSSVSVTSPAALTGTIGISNTISCFGGNDGALNLTPSGGSPGYTFSWSNGATTEDIANLSADNYQVNVTDSKGCARTLSFNLTQPASLNATFSLSDYNGVNVSCAGDNNGAISMTVSGGTSGYSFLWSTGSTSKDLSSIPAGSYAVQIKDSKNCSLTKSVTLTQPAPLSFTTSSIQPVLCFGQNTGSVTLSASGGTGTFLFSVNNGTTWQSSSTFSSLSAGPYTFKVKDSNNCQQTVASTITQPTTPLSLTESVTNTTCGQPNGAIQTNASGGTGAYTFQWLNGNNEQIGNTSQINALNAGIYQIIVTDQNLCSLTKNISVSSSNGPSVSYSSIPVTCPGGSDGSANLIIAGGSTPYTIKWPNGANTTTVTGLAAASYIVEISDATNCKVYTNVSVTAPAPILITETLKQQPTCFGGHDGKITVLATGGNGGFTYSWNTTATTPDLSDLMAGTYRVTVLDQKNCSLSADINLNDPPQFLIDLGQDKSVCVGQEVSIGVAIPDASYTWTGPNNFSSTTGIIAVSTPGTYSLLVTDANGCEAEDEITINSSTDLLKADLLMASQAHAGDTIVAIDISWPMPESIEWKIAPEAKTIYTGQDYSTFSFNEPGTYAIKIQAKLAQCISTYSQTIEILEKKPSTGGRVDTENNLIQVLKVFPNPIDDQLNVFLQLQDRREINLFLIQNATNQIVFKANRHEQILDNAYHFSHLSPGVYILVIRVGKETRSIRLLKD